MRLYYSTFIPRLGNPVQRPLEATLPCAKMAPLLDRLIAFESNANSKLIQDLPFVTNSVYVIKKFPRDSATISDLAMNVVDDRSLRINLPIPHHPRNTFRIVTSEANQLVQIDNAIMQTIEQRITGKTGLRPNRAKPDFEFWLSQRSEGDGFFAFRLSYHKAYDKTLQKGELRPELANILC